MRTAQAAAIDPSAYPDHVEAGGLTLPLSYAFEPGRRDDGITVDVPVAALQQVDPTPFTWQVPGLREELVTALIKTLPKTLRRQFAPAPDHARAVLARLNAGDEPLLDGLERELGRMRGVTIPRDAWELDRLPEHLTVTFRVVDERGAEVARGTDLEALRRELAPQVAAELAATDVTQSGLTTWTIGELPHEIGVRRGRHVVTGYPGLVDRGDSVDVRVFPTAAERDAAHARGVRRLLLLDTPSPARQVHRGLDSATRLVLARNPHGSVAALVDDCVTAAADALINAAGGPSWDERGYARLKALFAKRLPGTTQQVLDAVRGVLTVWHRVQSALTDLRRGAARPHRPARRPRRPRLRHPRRRHPPGRRGPLPGGGRAADREAARRPGPRRGVDGGGGRRRRRVRAAGGRPPARHRAVARAARDPLDDRGAAGEPLRAPDAHALPGVGPPDPAGHRRAVTRSSARSPFP